MLKQRQLQTGWLKLRLKNIESYIDFNVILQWEFCRYFWIVTCLFYARRAGQASFSFSLQRAVMHLYLYYIYIYIIFIFILYFNASIILYLPLLKTKPKDSVLWYVMIDFWTIRNLKVFCNIGILYYRRFIGVLYFGNLWSTF